MSKYTTEIRFLCESKAGKTESVGYNSIDEVLNTAAPLIFNFDFPIYDEAYRLPLEKRILKHYYTREISEETVGLWQLRLEDRLNLIMPYYNKLYTSALLDFNPLYDVDLQTEHTRKNDETRNGNVNREETSTRGVSDSENTEGEAVKNNTVNEEVNRSKSGTEDNSREFSESGTENKNRNNVNENSSETSRSGEEKNEETDNRNANDWELYSDTPQSGITGVMNAGGNLATSGYLTNATNTLKSENEIKDRSRNTSENESVSGKTEESEIENGLSEKSGNESGNKNMSETGRDTTVGRSTISDEYSNTKARTTNENGTVNVSGIENTIVDSLEDYSERVFGKRGGMSYSKMILEFRQTFLKIDQMILDELSDLFFGLW